MTKLEQLRTLNLEYWGTESNPENLPLWVATAWYLTQDDKYMNWLESYANLAYNWETFKFDQRPGIYESTSHDQLTAIAYLGSGFADRIVTGFDCGIFYTNNPGQHWTDRLFHPAHPIAYLGMSGSWWFWLWSPIWFITVLVAFFSVWKKPGMLATDSRIYHWLQLNRMIQLGMPLYWFRSLLLWITQFHPKFRNQYDWIFHYHRNNTHPVSVTINQVCEPYLGNVNANLF